MKKYICLLVLVLSSIAYSQVTQQWVRRYSGPGNYIDYATSIAVDASGNVCVTGQSYTSSTNADYYTIKYNSSGVQQWGERFNSAANAIDIANSIAVNSLGEICITGEMASPTTYLDYCTVKYNPTGSIAFFHTYDGPAHTLDEATSVAVDNSGNVYVTGYSMGNGTSFDYCTIKYNTSGSELWVRRYNGPSGDEDHAMSIAVDNSGNVYVTGRSTGNYFDYCTIKYNSSGVQQWVQRYNGPGNYSDAAYDVTVDNFSNVYVTGSSWGNGSSLDYCTIKYNASGVQQWVQRYNGPGNDNDEAHEIAVDNSGNVYITGGSHGSGTNYDFCTIKYNSSGVQQWARRYNNPANNEDVANSIAVDLSGNVFVTGYFSAVGTGMDYCTIKYNSSGVQQWLQSYNGPGNGEDIAYSLAIDNMGNTYVTGGSIGSGSNRDYCTIKYHEPIGIKPISGEIPDKFSLSQNYPNPFNPTTKIEFSIPLSRGVPASSGRGVLVTLRIYDLLGREVSTLVNEQLKSGTYEVEWDGTDYPSGVYFYNLISDSFNESKRMMLIK